MLAFYEAPRQVSAVVEPDGGAGAAAVATKARGLTIEVTSRRCVV